MAQGQALQVHEGFDLKTNEVQGEEKYKIRTSVEGKPTGLAKYITDNRRTGHTLLLTTEGDTVKGVIASAIGRKLSAAEYKDAEAALIQQGLVSNGKIIPGKYTTTQELRSSYHINRSLSVNLDAISEGANRGTATLSLGGEIAELATQVPGAVAGAAVTQIGSKLATGEWASGQETFNGALTGARTTNVVNLARTGVSFAAAKLAARRAAAEAESTVAAAAASQIDDAAAAVNQVDDVAKNANSATGNSPQSPGNSPSSGGSNSSTASGGNVSQGTAEEVVKKYPLPSPEYRYRGVHGGIEGTDKPPHPALEPARRGEIIPGNVNGTVTPEQHNLGGHAADSPFTSWTPDLEIARFHALKHGEGGVILRIQTGAPPPGSTWSWQWSPDYFGENEILLRGVRTGAEVLKP